MFTSIPDETPIDPSYLLIKNWDGLRSSLNLLEAENILKPTVKYLASPIAWENAPFTYEWMLEVHREMFCDVWSWAGKIRTCNLNLGSDFRYVETELRGLAEDLAVWVTSPETLITDAAELHHRAVKIHPFHNGNGRWSRLLANIWLWRSGSCPTVWPNTELSVVGAVRNEYIEAVKRADRLDRSLLVELHRRYTPTSVPTEDRE